MRWCSDVFEILCHNGEKAKLIFPINTCGITSELVKDLMAESIEYRFGKVYRLPHRIQWLSDNAPSYTAKDTIAFARMMRFEAPYYSPESNGMAEAFIKTFKRLCVYA